MVLVAIVLGVRWYLSSYLVTARVASQLAELYGGRVKVGGADLGLEHTVLTDVELFEQGSAPQPWLKIGRLEADVALTSLIEGQQPRAIKVHGLVIVLRFDDEGRLLTTLPPRPAASSAAPATLPDFDLTDGQVIFQGSGNRMLQIGNISAALKAAGPRLDVHAIGSNAEANWKADGTIDLAGKNIGIAVKSDRDIVVTPSLLNNLPFVPASVWREIQLDGRTPVSAALEYDWGREILRFPIHLEPRQTTLHVAAIDLTTTQTAGKVDIADGAIKLDGVHGLAYGGTIATDGTVSFPPGGVFVDLRKLDMQEVDVRQLPRSWSLPPQLAGRVDSSVALQIQSTPQKLRLHGTGTGRVREATFGGQPTSEPVDLALQDIQGATHLVVSAKLTGADLGALLQSFDAKLPPATSGKVNAEVKVQLPLQTINDHRTYAGTALVSLQDAQIAGLPLKLLQASVRCASDTLTTEDLQADLGPQGKAAGRGSLSLNEPYPLQLHLQPATLDLALVDQLDPSLRPAVKVAGHVDGAVDLTGTLKPWNFTTAGQATVKDLAAGGWELSAATFGWKSSAERWTITDINARAFGGTIAGTAELPLKAGARTELRLQFTDVEVGQLTREHFQVPIKVAGKASGSLHGFLGTDTKDLSLSLDAAADRVLLDGLPATAVNASLQYEGGMLGYRASGRALGGGFQLRGNVAMGQDSPSTRPQRGHLSLQQIDLGRLPAIWDPASATANVSGSADIEIDYRHEGTDHFPLGKGRLIVSDAAWKDQVLADQIEATVSLDRDKLTVNDIAATLGQGTVAGKVVINLKQPERSWLRLNVDNVEASDALKPWPALAQEIHGSLMLRLRGTLGRVWTGNADVELTRGKVFGVEVSEWTVPLHYSFEPAAGTGQLDISDSTASVAQGRVNAQLRAVWTDTLRLDGSMKFTGVDLRQALPAAHIGKGQISGHAEFQGAGVRSIDDIDGTLVATLQQTQALELPVLKQLAPILGLASTTTFQSGDVRARLSRGVVHVERLTFPEGPLQLYAEGSVTLQGRVNMDVTANTGKLTNVAAMLGVRLPQSGSITAELLRRATAALSPNLVHVRVRGTVQQPSMEVVPLPMLTEQTLRFFAGMRQP
jgi:hypothetical protein